MITDCYRASSHFLPTSLAMLHIWRVSWTAQCIQSSTAENCSNHSPGQKKRELYSDIVFSVAPIRTTSATKTASILRFYVKSTVGLRTLSKMISKSDLPYSHTKVHLFRCDEVNCSGHMRKNDLLTMHLYRLPPITIFLSHQGIPIRPITFKRRSTQNTTNVVVFCSSVEI